MVTDERALRDATVACYFNARDLYSAAKLLNMHGYSAQAVALAIISMEELAKAVAYVIASIVPDQRDTLMTRKPDLKDHSVKHLLMVSATAAALSVGEPAKATKPEAGFRSSREYIVFLLLELARRPLADQLPTRKEAKKTYKGDQDSSSMTLAELKNSALYVELEQDGTLNAPQRVAWIATNLLDDLEWLFEHYAFLPDIARNDPEWDEVVNGVRSVLTKYGCLTNVALLRCLTDHQHQQPVTVRLKPPLILVPVAAPVHHQARARLFEERHPSCLVSSHFLLTAGLQSLTGV